MAKSELKTKITDASVAAFLDKINDSAKRDDCYAIVEMMKSVTKQEPHMYGSAIVGFGTYHYVYESGREGDAPLLSFSPRAANITLYLKLGAETGAEELLKSLGKHKTGKGCLYITALKDVDTKTLKEIMKRTYEYMKKTYPSK